MRYFCTLFDQNYLLKGLALHSSLIKYVPEFRLWILCMDRETYEILLKLNLPKTELIKLEDFEDEELLKVKPNRKKSEYCWTCTSSLPLYIFNNNPKVYVLAYLDADLFFFDSLGVIYEEFGNSSIMIIPHNFSEDQKWREKTSGIYNVGMLLFRNDENALGCLKWWRSRVLEWCYDTYEDGKLGDQLYLNDWPQRFKNIHILKNRGANVASWNIRDFNIKTKLIFYHFHNIRLYYIFGKVIARIENMDLDSIKPIFSAYSESLAAQLRRVRKIDPGFAFGFSSNLSYLKWVTKKALLRRFGNMLTFFREVFDANKRSRTY